MIFTRKTKHLQTCERNGHCGNPLKLRARLTLKFREGKVKIERHISFQIKYGAKFIEASPPARMQASARVNHLGFCNTINFHRGPVNLYIRRKFTLKRNEKTKQLSLNGESPRCTTAI